MTQPGTYELKLYRGDTYTWQFILWTDEEQTIAADLTDVVAKAEVRTVQGGPVLFELDCSIEDNKVNMLLPVDKWVGVTGKSAVWDLQLTYPTEEVRTILQGKVTITPDVTDTVEIV